MKRTSLDYFVRNEKIIPLIFLAAGCTLLAFLWSVNSRNEQQRLELETLITAQQTQLRLESCINSRLALVRTLGDQQWQDASQLLNQWYGLAESLYPLFSGIQALNYVDNNRVIRVVYPLADNEGILNFDLDDHFHPSVVRAIEQADKENKTSRTKVLELLQTGQGIVFYHPILSEEGRKLGFVNGVFRLNELIAACLGSDSLNNRFILRLYETDDTMFYQQPDTFTGDILPGFVTLQTVVADMPWKMELSPSPEFVRDNTSLTNNILIALGFALVGVLSLAGRNLIRQQNSLLRSQDDYRLLVENQSDMLVKVNMDFEFLYVSPSYCKTFGVSEADIINQKFMPLVHEDDIELTMKSLERLHQPPHHSYHEQRAKTAEGWRWLAWSNTGVLNDKGEVIEITAVGRDVTEIKNLEARIARSQKMHAIGEMAGGITHDFNNLLQVMSGYVEFLQEQMPPGDAKREQLGKVSEMIERAMNLTKQLATLSRQQPTESEVIDLNKFTLELLDLLKRTLPGSITLTVENIPGKLKVLADKTQLEQVLLNICFNARDAIASTGNIRIQTGIRTLDEAFLGTDSEISPGEYAVVNIEDDGCGISRENMSRIFDPFFTTKGDQSGTGLGLANCYSIIRKHKGTITVDSEFGNGSRFSIFLPLSEEKMAKTKPDTERREQVTKGAGKILIADDNQEVLNLVEQILDSAGLETISAKDGAEAVALYHEHSDSIAMVILDLVMPNKGGFEAADELKLSYPDLKVLFISGYIPENKLDTLSASASILYKPFKSSDLIAKVRELLDQ